MNMLQKLKQNYTRWVSSYLNKTRSVRLGAPLGTRLSRIKKFITNKKYMFNIEYNDFVSKYDIKNKFIFVFEWSINIIVTGFTIQYCIEHQNAISYGLTTLLVMFYFEKIVLIIKQPIAKNEDK